MPSLSAMRQPTFASCGAERIRVPRFEYAHGIVDSGSPEG